MRKKGGVSTNTEIKAELGQIVEEYLTDDFYNIILSYQYNSDNIICIDKHHLNIYITNIYYYLDTPEIIPTSIINSIEYLLFFIACINKILDSETKIDKKIHDLYVKIYTLHTDEYKIVEGNYISYEIYESDISKNNIDKNIKMFNEKMEMQLKNNIIVYNYKEYYIINTIKALVDYLKDNLMDSLEQSIELIADNKYEINDMKKKIIKNITASFDNIIENNIKTSLEKLEHLKALLYIISLYLYYKKYYQQLIEISEYRYIVIIIIDYLNEPKAISVYIPDKNKNKSQIKINDIKRYLKTKNNELWKEIRDKETIDSENLIKFQNHFKGAIKIYAMCQSQLYKKIKHPSISSPVPVSASAEVVPVVVPVSAEVPVSAPVPASSLVVSAPVPTSAEVPDINQFDNFNEVIEMVLTHLNTYESYVSKIDYFNTIVNFIKVLIFFLTRLKDEQENENKKIYIYFIQQVLEPDAFNLLKFANKISFDAKNLSFIVKNITIIDLLEYLIKNINIIEKYSDKYYVSYLKLNEPQINQQSITSVYSKYFYTVNDATLIDVLNYNRLNKIDIYSDNQKSVRDSVRDSLTKTLSTLQYNEIIYS